MYTTQKHSQNKIRKCGGIVLGPSPVKKDSEWEKGITKSLKLIYMYIAPGFTSDLSLKLSFLR